jgi:hypothetical protein
MPDTGERREITGRVNAKEAETVQRSKKMLTKTKQLSASMDAKNRPRGGKQRRAEAAGSNQDSRRIKRRDAS